MDIWPGYARLLCDLYRLMAAGARPCLRVVYVPADAPWVRYNRVGVRERVRDRKGLRPAMGSLHDLSGLPE